MTDHTSPLKRWHIHVGAQDTCVSKRMHVGAFDLIEVALAYGYTAAAIMLGPLTAQKEHRVLRTDLGVFVNDAQTGATTWTQLDEFEHESVETIAGDVHARMQGDTDVGATRLLVPGERRVTPLPRKREWRWKLSAHFAAALRDCLRKLGGDTSSPGQGTTCGHESIREVRELLAAHNMRAMYDPALGAYIVDFDRQDWNTDRSNKRRRIARSLKWIRDNEVAQPGMVGFHGYASRRSETYRRLSSYACKQMRDEEEIDPHGWEQSQARWLAVKSFAYDRTWGRNSKVDRILHRICEYTQKRVREENGISRRRACL